VAIKKTDKTRRIFHNFTINILFLSQSYLCIKFSHKKIIGQQTQIQGIFTGFNSTIILIWILLNIKFQHISLKK
jgi:hypothetical protein